jgi:hypothetical protein
MIAEAAAIIATGALLGCVLPLTLAHFIAHIGRQE